MMRALFACVVVSVWLGWGSVAGGSELHGNDEHESESSEEGEDYDCDEQDPDPLEVQYLELSTQTIAFRDSCGDGPLVVLVHGNSASGLTFRHQLEGDFGETHRVIAFDLPGHGDSEPFADPFDYSLPGYAAVVAEAAEALEMEEAVFVGWSLGGHIVLEAHDELLEAKGFFIYGTPPVNLGTLAAGFLPHPAGNFGFIPDLDEAMAEEYATAFLTPGSTIDIAAFVADILRTDPQARGGLFNSVVAGNFEDEVAIVGDLSTPLAITHGTNEQLVSGDYIETLDYSSLWRGKVHYIDGAGHATHWEQVEEFNRVLERFVDDVS